MMAEKSILYSGWRRKILYSLCVFLLLSLILSIERTVIDSFGQMWVTMFLNCMAIVWSLACLLGICAKERIVFALYAAWCVLAIGLNLIVLLIYQDVGLLARTDHYLGLSENYWKTHGLMCRSHDGSSYGSGFTSGDGDGVGFAEFESYNSCLISYSVVEMVHAAIYIVLATVSLVLCCLLLYPLGKNKRFSHEVDEDFCYISEAQTYDYPTSRSTQPRSLGSQGYYL